MPELSGTAGFLLSGQARESLFRRLMVTLGAGQTLLCAFDVATGRHTFVAANQQLLLLRLAHHRGVTRDLDDLDHAQRAWSRSSRSRVTPLWCASRRSRSCWFAATNV